MPLAYQSSEPPNQSDDELELIDVRPVSHDGDAVRAVGFVVDGAEVRVVSGGSDGHLRYWKLDPMMEVVDLALPNIPYDLDVFDDGGMYIVATGEGGWKGHAGSDTLRILDASGSPLMQTQVPIGFVYSVAFSPLGWWGWIAASGFYGDIVMYRTSDLQLYATTATKKKRTQALAFSPDGSFVATASTAGIQLRSFPSDCALDDCELDLLLTLSHSGSWSFSIAFRPDSTSERIEMVSGTDSGKTKFWFIENVATNPTASLVRSLDSGAVYALAWSPDGDRIVAGEGGDITVYDSTDLDDLRILFRNVDAHAGRVNDVAFSPDNSMIVSGGADGALKLWMFPTP